MSLQADSKAASVSAPTISSATVWIFLQFLLRADDTLQRLARQP
jgi:hypothetical protein